MDFLKEWTLTVCITLVLCVIFSMLTPKGNMGRTYKIILAVFIFLSFILPLKSGNMDFDMPFFELEEEFQNKQNYNAIIENVIVNKLNDGGYSSCSVSCDTNYDNQEVEIRSVKIGIPAQYDDSEVKDYVFDSVGMLAEVYYIGE